MVSCSAEKAATKVAAIAAAAAIAVAAPLGAPEEAFARDVQPYAGLTPCKKNKAFAKREKQEIKALEKRLKKYDPESAPALALKATMDKTSQRFKNYGEAGLLCGADGLPQIPDLADMRMRVRLGPGEHIRVPIRPQSPCHGTLLAPAGSLPVGARVLWDGTPVAPERDGEPPCLPMLAAL